MNKRIHFVVSTVYFMAFLGIAMPYPVMTPLFMSGAIDVPFSREASLGIALAVYPLGLFFGGGTLGAFSDKYGRRPVLLTSLVITTLGTVWSGYAILQQDFWQLVISRLVTGYFEANGSIARSMLVDLTEGESKASTFAMLGVAGYGGYLVGPLLGGYLAVFGGAVPFLVAGFMGLGALIMAAMWLPETNQRVRAGTSAPKRPGILKMMKDHPIYRKVLLAQFLLTIGTNTFYQFYPMLLVKRWGADSVEIALTNMYFTGAMILFAVFGVKRLEKNVSLGHSLILGGSVLSALMLVILVAPSNLVGIFIATFIGFAVAIMNASIPAFMSRETVAELEQGAVMGSLSSSFCLAQAVISVLGSKLAVYGIEYSFILGSAVAMLGVLQIQYIRRSGGGAAKSSAI